MSSNPKTRKRPGNNMVRILGNKDLQKRMSAIRYEYRETETESTALESIFSKLFQLVEADSNSRGA